MDGGMDGVALNGAALTNRRVTTLEPPEKLRQELRQHGPQQGRQQRSRAVLEHGQQDVAEQRTHVSVFEVLALPQQRPQGRGMRGEVVEEA